MKIGIDARFIGPEGTGLGKYTEKLIENLTNLDSKNQYVIFLRRSNWNWLKLKSANFTKILTDIPWYSISEQVKLPRIFASQNLDLLHIPHFNAPIFYKGKFVVTIHDLIHHQFSQESATTRNFLIFKIKRFAYSYIINHAVKNSQKILTPSNFVKSEIINTFEVNSAKIVVTYEAAEEEYLHKISSARGTDQISNLLMKYNIKTPYIIYVGNAYPHKNLNRLLDAFKILIEQHPWGVLELSSIDHPRGENKLKLVIVCPRDVFWKRLKDKIKELGLEEQVFLTGYIPADELSIILRSAEAYIFPSLSEGFGIPGLNAMAVGLPVICSNIPTLNEVYGDAALYFDPNNPKDIANKISLVVLDREVRSKLIDSGYKQVKKYSWLKMAEKTLRVYKQFQ